MKLNPHLFWPAIGVAVNNTLGGMVTWAMGLASHKVVDRLSPPATYAGALDWLKRIGPKACLLAWLPVVGDLCAGGGLARPPFWPCVAYMAIGKLTRYTLMTAALVGVFGAEVRHRPQAPPHRRGTIAPKLIAAILQTFSISQVPAPPAAALVFDPFKLVSRVFQAG